MGEGECVWRDHGEIEREKMKETSLTEIGHVFANPFLCFYNFSTCLENKKKKPIDLTYLTLIKKWCLFLNTYFLRG